ncbi:hypothetical protein EDD90_5080 [Streptomyces sp. Ag109_O5-1]|uniref:hypothetical protein n=1 Tax=Streptomyces sp. Ag109_O5-1 TaxID=1938851 RepID=UPI000F501E7C|nr:hypothetical protein [Streptomyces sp. Ag109_O5-1]RPE41979.1 hypothetical protein EDD90_5080 [Streptomyces sp. Ag109_O5-1]
MRTRSLVSAAVSAALGAALLAAPTLAYADGGPGQDPAATATTNPTTGPTPTDTPTSTPSDTPSDTPLPSDPSIGEPSDTPTSAGPTPSDTPSGDPTPDPSSHAPADGTGAPVFGNVGSDPSDAGFLTVAVSSDSAVTEVSADLTELHGSAPATVAVTGFTLVSGTPQDGVWRSPRMSQLPSYGSYDVTVSAQDSDGDNTTSAHATTVDVEPKPVFADRSISPAVLDVEHTHVTLSGRISLFDPITGDTSPLAGQALSVVAEYSYSAVTAADGSYAIDVAPKLNGENATSVPVSLSFWIVNPDGTNTYVLVDSKTLPVVVSPSRIRLDHSSVQIKFGAKASSSGVVEYLYDGTWRPAKGVALDMGYYATTTSGDGGRFTLTDPYIPYDDATFTVETSSDSYLADPYLTASHAQFKVDVINKTSICFCSSWIDEYSDLHIQGSMTASNGKVPPNRKLYLQQSADGKTGWKSLGWFTTKSDGTFNLDGYVAVPKGYWRLYSAGSSDYQPGYSNSVHFNRTATRITGFNAGPEPVRKGHTVTTTGTLQRLSGTKWVAFGKQRVYILFQAKGKKSWTQLGSVKADSHGHFTARFTAKQDGTWVGVYLASGSYVDAESYHDYVDVR